MNKIMTWILFAVFTIFSHVAWAADEKTERKDVKNLMQNYIATIACESEPVSDKDIFTIQPPSEDGAIYFVLWRGNIGCYDDPTSQQAYISEVSRFSLDKPLLVKNNDAFGHDNEQYRQNHHQHIDYRLIERVEQMNAYRFEITTSNQYIQDKDSQHLNKSVKNMSRYIVSFIDGKGWQITDKLVLK